MAVIDQALIRSRRARRPETLADLMTMVGLTSGVANIIMQLSLPAVGHGVHESRVVSGSPRRRPFKRLRTTSQHLVVSVLGNESDRDAFREEMRAVHAHVHSTESSPVRYSGNARDLQLWVAACLFRFYIDQYERLYGPLDRAALDVLTPAAAPLATGVNVPESAWPQSWHEFEDYWDSMLPSLSIAPEVRDDLKSSRTSCSSTRRSVPRAGSSPGSSARSTTSSRAATSRRNSGTCSDGSGPRRSSCGSSGSCVWFAWRTS